MLHLMELQLEWGIQYDKITWQTKTYYELLSQEPEDVAQSLAGSQSAVTSPRSFLVKVPKDNVVMLCGIVQDT